MRKLNFCRRKTNAFVYKTDYHSASSSSCRALMFPKRALRSLHDKFLTLSNKISVCATSVDKWRAIWKGDDGILVRNVNCLWL